MFLLMCPATSHGWEGVQSHFAILLQAPQICTKTGHATAICSTMWELSDKVRKGYLSTMQGCVATEIVHYAS